MADFSSILDVPADTHSSVVDVVTLAQAYNLLPAADKQAALAGVAELFRQERLRVGREEGQAYNSTWTPPVS